MSTAVERLRKFAEAREAQRRGRDTRRHKGEAEREQIEPRVERMAALCLRKAEHLAKATGMSIPVWLSNGLGATATGFRLRAGTCGSLVAQLAENGWDVKTYLRTEDRSFTYPTDREFEEAHQPLLESVLGSVLERRPAGLNALHGASVDPPAGAPRDGSLISVFWQALRRGLSGLSIAPRPAAQTTTAAFAANPAEPTRDDQPRLPDTEDATPPDAESHDRVAARIQALQRGLSGLSVAPRPAAQTTTAALAANLAEPTRDDQPRLPDTEDATPPDAESHDRVAARIQALQRGLSGLSVAPRPAAQMATAALAAKPAEPTREDLPWPPDTENATTPDAESHDHLAARIRERLRYAKELLGHAEKP